MSQVIRMARDSDRTKYTPPPHAMHLIAQMYVGIEHLHLVGTGILVRDVKPENVLIGGKGKRCKLTDFGMSRSGRTSNGEFSLGEGQPPGTPHYVSPEVITGKGYDHNADFYSY